MTQRPQRKRIAAQRIEQITDVLIVDDNDGIRKMIRFALEDAGYRVLEALDGVEALDYLSTHVNRLVVVLDLNLPRLDGWGLLRAVDGTPLAKRHRFVLATAQGDFLPRALIHLLSQLRVPVLAKPCSLDRILEAVSGRGPIAAVDDDNTLANAH
jgi:CheY-like chemotaxis protein